MARQKGFAVISGSSTVIAKITENGQVVFGQDKSVDVSLSGTLVVKLPDSSVPTSSSQYSAPTDKVLHVDSSGSGSIGGVSANQISVPSTLTVPGLTFPVGGAGNVSDALSGLSTSISQTSSSLNSWKTTSTATTDQLRTDINSLSGSVAVVAANNLVAAKTYADQKVAALVDSAPALLDTLNELAAAIADDQNFAVTVTNNISTAITNLSGSTTTALASEASVRAAAITSLSGSTTTALASEASARAAADTALGARATSLEATTLIVNGTAGEIEVTSGTLVLGQANTMTIGLPDNVTVSGNLVVNGNTTLGNNSSDLIQASGRFQVPKFDASTIPASYLTGVQTANSGHMFYLDAANDAVAAFPQGNKWYFCENGEWFASPFFMSV